MTRLLCHGCETRCKPCVHDLRQKKDTKAIRANITSAEEILIIDELADRIRTDLIKLRQDIGKKTVAPIGAFIFQKTIKKPNGKLYEYWYVRGYNSEDKDLEKSLGSTKRPNQKVNDYRARIARRDQIQAIDSRLTQIENYLKTSKQNVLPFVNEQEEKDDD